MIEVIGIGLDGWQGLTPTAREILSAARDVVGSERQRALVRGHHEAREHDLPTPLRPGLHELPADVVILASGDPLHYGIGATLVDELGSGRVRVHPGMSSMSLACARLGWAVEGVDVVSLVGRPSARLLPALHDGARVLVLVADRSGPGIVADLLRRNGFGQSVLHILTDLGGPGEGHVRGAALWWSGDAASDLAVVAVECRGEGLPLTPGLPDDAYDHDGQLTKQHVRAVTLAALAPRPGQLLWDIGGGSGSIGIEWLRAHRSCRAVSVEQDPSRAARMRANADRLAGGRLTVVEASAPGALADLPEPDAVFVGGGLTVPGLRDLVLPAMRPGARFVANAVTLESQALLVAWFAELGGTLTRLDVSRTDTVGRFTAWQPARPLTQWVWRKDGR